MVFVFEYFEFSLENFNCKLWWYQLLRVSNDIVTPISIIYDSLYWAHGQTWKCFIKLIFFELIWHTNNKSYNFLREFRQSLVQRKCSSKSNHTMFSTLCWETRTNQHHPRGISDNIYNSCYPGIKNQYPSKLWKKPNKTCHSW